MLAKPKHPERCRAGELGGDDVADPDEQVGMPAEIIARARTLRPDADLDATGLLLALQQKEQHLSAEVAAACARRGGTVAIVADA